MIWYTIAPRVTIGTATPAQIRAALALRGWSVGRVAKELGISIGTVSNVIRRRMTSSRISTHIETIINHPPSAGIGPRAQGPQ